MSTKEISSKVKELKELKVMCEDLGAEITALEDLIKAEMVARDTEELVTDLFKIRWTTVSSSRIDTAGLKKELPEIAARFTKQVVTRRFSIV